MREDTEAREPSCEQACDSVRDKDVDLRQPSLAEAHHQDPSCGDCNSENGYDAHRSVFYDGICFDFDQPVWVNEAYDLHDRVCRADAAEELAMYGGDLLPILDAREQDPGADYV